LCGLALLVLVGLVTAILATRHREAATTAAALSPATTTNTTVVPTTTTTVAPTTTTTATDAVNQWRQANQSTVSELYSSVQGITTAQNSCSSVPFATCNASVESACSNLAGIVKAAQGLPPMPVPAGEGYWASALSDFNQGAQACLTGANTDDVQSIEQSLQEIHAGIGEMTNLTSLISDYTSQSTTTTTWPVPQGTVPTTTLPMPPPCVVYPTGTPASAATSDSCTPLGP
jgi:hypothetical protein